MIGAWLVGWSFTPIPHKEPTPKFEFDRLPEDDYFTIMVKLRAQADKFHDKYVKDRNIR